MSFFSQLRAAVQKRVAYSRTVYELRGISAQVAEDTGVFPASAERVAREVIYG